MKRLAAIVLIALTILPGCSATVGSSCVDYIECGMCGAHVIQWWYVSNNDNEPIEVCEYCYLEARDM